MGGRRSDKRFIFLAALSLSVLSLSGQNGAPLLSHYEEFSNPEDQSWSICRDENNVMMFANRRGILTYDGQDWSLIRIPVIPYSVKYNPEDRRVYIGGENNYGYMERDDLGFYRFYSLAGDSSGVGIISDIIFTDSTVYFYGEKSISRHNMQTGNLELRLRQKAGKPFSGMFVTPKNTFINVMSEGLYRLESDTLFPIVSGYLLENKQVLFSLPYKLDLVLLGINTGNLFLFDGIKFYYYQLKDEGYIKQNILSDGIMISDSLYAFSTLDGGVEVIDKNTGNIRYTINYQNGLPDDEVLAIGTDNCSGLWISHHYGLARAELLKQLGNFTIYPGLKGNLINSIFHNNELYVATGEGIFYLTEVKEYTKVEILVVSKIPPAQLPIPDLNKTPDIAVQAQEQEQPEKPQGLLSRIFGRRAQEPVKEEKHERDTVEAVTSPPVISRLNEPAYTKKTINRLKSVHYEFKKVEGLNDKCKQMVSTSDGILASTNRGLFVISDHVAKEVLNDRYINYISSESPDNKYFIALADGYVYVRSVQGKWQTGIPDNQFKQPLNSIVFSRDNTIWAGIDGGAIKIKLDQSGTAKGYHTYRLNNDYLQRCLVDYVNDTLLLFTDSGISYYDDSIDSIKPYGESINEEVAGAKTKFVLTQPGAPWINQGNGDWRYLSSSDRIQYQDRAILKIFDEIVTVNVDSGYIWVINGDNQLFRIVRNEIPVTMPGIDLFIKSITNEKGSYFRLSDIVFGRGDNNVYFDLVAPGYLKQNSTRYQYIVDKMMTSWSKWSTSSVINLIMQPGSYTLKVRAKDIWGNISDTKSLYFTIKTPFTKTTPFYLVLGFLALSFIISIVRFRERQLQKEKRVLEEKVRERTAEIEAQKREITSSIEYASRIQMAILPVKDLFNNGFKENFIFFKPRDIVSGDFYWITEDEDRIYFTVADCTGHGVPGAFMSTISISIMNEIITHNKKLHANTILNLLREKIKNYLHQTGKEGETSDGLDVSFCILNKNKKLLEFSGAFNPLVIFQQGELKEYRADRMPIGIYHGEKESFTNYEINVNDGDTIYLFSDGFSGQFGGPDGTKYKKANLKKLLAGIYNKPLEEQKQIIEVEFETWKGDGEQIDDITILGVRI
jgi:serine phosphatase RsbU (regulator of sigma subunit)